METRVNVNLFVLIGTQVNNDLIAFLRTCVNIDSNKSYVCFQIAQKKKLIYFSQI